MKTAPADDLSFKQKARIIGGVLAFGALLFAVAMVPIVNLAQREKAARVVAVTALKIQKEKTKMEEIALGNTKTVRCYYAGRESFDPTSGYGPNCYDVPSAGTGGGAPYEANGATNGAGWSAAWGSVAENSSPTSADYVDVEVSVPVLAQVIGEREILVSSTNDITTGQTTYSGLVDVYAGAFEVVCMTVKIVGKQ